MKKNITIIALLAVIITSLTITLRNLAPNTDDDYRSS
ncbi:MAG: hypothetical protein M2R45_05039 [Verrucomicrobia subdivision 3 bacterium]|nr:hypothetical protein [Limisphaerales bacterium]MCS1412559.1 hypothetical protein [Limisphaerales bacterium]